MAYYMRYFADASLALDGVKRGLTAQDPGFKIDGGEVSREGDLLAEIEINKPGSDMFDDEIAGMLGKLQQTSTPATQAVMGRVQGTQAVLAVSVLGDDTSASMEKLQPLWTVLQALATGLWHIEGQGFYDNGQLLVAV